MESQYCAICMKSFQETSAAPTVNLGVKGSDSINQASFRRKGCSVSVSPGETVHTECRRNFIHSRNTKSQDGNTETPNMSPTTRSGYSFDFKSKCLFCGKDAKLSNRKRAMNVYPVRTIEFQNKVKEKCIERNDDWSKEILSRITFAIDLPAADAVYHQTCNVNFRTNRSIPKCFTDDYASPIKVFVGRPDSLDTKEAFNKVVAFLKDNPGSVYSISELVEIMEDQCGERAYSCKYLKKKLIDYFGDTLSISTIKGKETKITFKQTVAEILYDFAKESSDISEQDKKEKILSTAAKLIRNDINLLESNKENYTSFSNISSVEENKQFLPESLHFLLSKMIRGKDVDIKVSSIGQAIVQACRPKNIIAPLQIGLAVQLHHHFGSRFLIDLLNNLGFGASYFEVQKFESSAASSLNTQIPSFSPGKFLQFVADNADHNTATLDGHGTFHGMGIIACTTPGSKLNIPIPRSDITADELTNMSKIDIKFFKGHDSIDLDNICFQDLSLLDTESVQTVYNLFDTFSKVIWPLKSTRPSWSGFMQLYDKPTSASFQERSTITFLPMIDMNASDLSCIHSTLWFVSDQSRKYGVTPVLTFDQPLFQKATYIIECCEYQSPLRKIVLRLGAFHTQMSFLGCIGYLMSGSGLQAVLQSAYAGNAVTHMLTGKAVNRAMRGHFLVETALYALLMSKAFGMKLPLENTCELEDPELEIQATFGDPEPDSSADILQEQDYHLVQTGNDKNNEVLEHLNDLYGKLEKDQLCRDDICKSETMSAAQLKLNETKNSLRSCRTASLWLQYMDMVSILQQFIRSERTSDWIGHLKALKQMLPFFAASGHNLYLKSAYVYLQKMLKLENDHPDIYQQFLNGNHSVRRSDRYWAGLSTDLTIEQMLMRSLKTTGGLTRGRGMTEQQRALWIMSMPASAEMNHAMQQFSNTEYETSYQHKDVGVSRSIRDERDTKLILQFLTRNSPFDEADPSLRNIETGVTADGKVDAERAKHIGENIICNMVGKSVYNYSFKRTNQAVTMNDSMSIKITGETVTIDPQLLFQRITAVADRCVDDLPTLFQYELSSIPSSLFDNDGLPRVPQKSLLSDAIWKLGDCAKVHEREVSDISSSYVLDGGSLLQKLPWPKHGSFGSICQQYYNYISQRYLTKSTTVVFDGYSNGPSTKDITHCLRSRGAVDTRVNFTYNTPFKSKKESFLRNVENKQTFINLLGDYLIRMGICIKHANNDADRLIVETAVEQSESNKTFVIGEDTDLLVLLCYYVKDDSYEVYFRSDKVISSMKPQRVWDIKKTQKILTRQVCNVLPFIHALTGCDTTSRIHGMGKSSALKLIRKSATFRETAVRFMASESKQDTIILGEMALKFLFEGESSENLNILRYQKFASQVMRSSTCVQVQSLPPSSAAAAFHSLRVYYQLQSWIADKTLNAEEWGWELRDGIYYPTKTSLPPAPDYLLNIIRCNCKTNCDSKKCSCRKHGLDCSVGCGTCRGVSCSNCHAVVDL